MKEVLIINLTRMGDLIQTTPVIIGLKEKYPDVRITLLVNSVFRPICNLIPLIDQIIEFDLRGASDLIIKNDLIQAYKYINDVLDTVNSRQYDMAINFTHSTDSAVLLSLINSTDQRGISIDKEGYSIKKHPWAKYVFNVIPSRIFNPFHLCDMHCKIASVLPRKKGLLLSVNESMIEQMAFKLKKYGVDDNSLVVALQLGASTDEKRWPVESFARMAELLSKNLKVFFVLTGAQSESHYGHQFEKLAKVKTINLIGKTSLTELAALLKHCHLLISNDTGPLHIATAVGTKVINISLASVHFRETGPYGEGHYVVVPEISCYPCMFNTTCRSFRCRDKIKPDKVYHLAKAVLTNNINDISIHKMGNNIQIYRSFFDRDGLIEYEPMLKGKDIKREELFTHLYRLTWQTVLDEKHPGKDEIEYTLNKILTWYKVDSIDEVITDGDFKDFSRVANLSQTIISILSPMLKESKKINYNANLIKVLWRNLVPIDKDLERLSYVNGAIKPIIVLLKYDKESFIDENISSTLHDAIKAYRRVFVHSQLFLNLLSELKEKCKTGGKVLTTI